MKTKIKVFPDHLSSGLWDYKTGNSLELDSFIGVLSYTERMAIKYWHEAWEFLITNEKLSMSKSYKTQWLKDGETLVTNLNVNSYNFEFIYCATEKDIL